MKKTTRILATAVASVGLVLGGLVAVRPQQAEAATSVGVATAGSCPAGLLCIWVEPDAKGKEYRYGGYDNHQHKVASLYYNYNNSDVSFWTDVNGTGERITGYKLDDRGFRNWSKGNRDRCESHVDRFK
jgi:hypothetical protein